MGADQHPEERTKKPSGEAFPLMACPKCKDTPGLEFDADGGGGFYVDCRYCHGSAKVPNVAKLAGKGDV